MQSIKYIFKKYPLHPLFVALFPVIALLAANIDKTPVSHAINPALVSMLGALVVWGVLYIMTRSYRTSALAVSWFLVLFFSYGYFYTLIGETVRHRYVLALWGLLLCGGVFYAYRPKASHRTITMIANIMAVVLVALSLLQIAAYKIRTFITDPPLSDHIAAFDYGIVTRPEVLPDIYYIIIDAYASEWSFKEFFNFDISEFTSYLTRLGFYVVPKSTSNYSKTIYSLSSQLNMEYLDTIVGLRYEEEKLGKLLENNRLIHFMNQQGYHTIHIGSPWTPTLNNRYADENINYQPVPFGTEFSLILYNTTVLETVTEAMDLLDHRKVQWKRIQHEFDELERIASRPESTYVFAHLEIPHHPYVFDTDGSFVPANIENGREEKENYVRQVRYLNTKLTRLVDHIFEESDTSPIIIIQSDHGSGITPDNGVLTLEGARRDFIFQEGMRNFSALFLPGKRHLVLSETLTPVNVVRIVLNEYFGTNLDMLPNKNFFKVTDVPGFIEATDIVQYK
ncbi:MAG: hypothetical protein G01um101448_99 [Parcubacteria group bacterium Gr01-1014_48]|nr:MAG: hypothetical protein Greene041614_20 [Parcubacteria group bacterium Greene0416_14]TSC74458.1 MAG: hypothetical protein G01um101448_99 [Parcubacteria group bacterium Gr01-1014_48]TSD01768.1 MAG: hypothetical protein Greene101415_26 [Parcubacteria group bacterium Greene1014_15]TSD08482.1 MAG: hypothetical protein Greene07144_21 [Parcubacteria group bacterium Greene0714_4]